MRTNFNVTAANRNVFGFGQDRVVLTLEGTYAPATQHLASRHASHCACESKPAAKRPAFDRMAMAGAVQWLRHLYLAITGLQGQPVRLASPAVGQV